MPATPRPPAAPAPAADPEAGPMLCLLDRDHCHYSICLPARMAEAGPGLPAIAARLQALLQSATRAPVPLTAERTPCSVFLLIDLDLHRAEAPTGAYALQQQGRDILISGKNAAAVALGVARLLREIGFQLQADGRVTPPPASAAGAVIWRARDRIELTPPADPGWLAALGVSTAG